MERFDYKHFHDEQLSLYRVRFGNKDANKSWYYQIRIPKQKRIRDKTTNQTNFSNALLFAETQFKKVQQKLTLGLPIYAI